MTRIVSPIRRRCAFVFAVAFVAMWLTVRSLGGTAAIEPPTLQQDMTMSMASSRLTPPRSVAIGGDTTQQTTTTLVQTEHPVSTVTKKSAAGWQPIDRAVILHADVMDAAAKFLLELGGGPAARYVLVFSDERIFTSALHRLRSDNVVATLILFADCGERLGVARITDLDGTILHDMPVPSCTLGPQHSSVRVARWLSISSGSFLMDSVRVLLTFWFHDTGAVDNSQLILSTDSRIVVIDPLAVRLWKGAHRNFTLTSLMALFSAPPSTVVMARFALGVERLNTTLRFIAPDLARWRSRLEKLLDPLPSSSFGGGALDRLATSGQSTLMSPYLFGGGRDALVTLVDSVAELQVRYPMPPGVGMELVLAASLNEVRTGHSSARFAVQLLSEHTVRMASDSRCSVMHTLLRQQEMIASVTPPPPPAMLLNWHHCTWSKPMQPAPVAQPFCHSRWFDDYYLLHEANAKDPARMIPTAVIAPTSLGVAWEEIGKNREGNDAIVLNESMIEEPYLRRCVGRGRSAVLGMCTGYAPELVKTFVKTFAKFHLRSCTQLYLFVDDEQRIAYNETFGGEADIVIVVIDALKSTLRLQSCGVVNWRKELFYEWLLLKERSEEDANWLRYVMIVDTRDAHFQADPFEPLRKIAPEVRRRLGQVKRTTPTHGAQAPPGVLYLLSERFELGSVSVIESQLFDLERGRVASSCGVSAFDWGVTVPLMPLLPVDVVEGDEEAFQWPLEGHGVVNAGLYFGNYAAMKSVLKLLVDSMSACSNVTAACGTSNDQGMLICLAMGGFANARYPHDVVMLNPDTQPYTHMFRYESSIQFYEPGAHVGSEDPFGNAFVYPCARSQRSLLARRSSGQSPLDQPYRKSFVPYAVIHQSEYEVHHHFYVTETLGKI